MQLADGTYAKADIQADLEQQIRDLERQLGGASYPLETTLARINQLGDRLSEGTTKQRKQALSLMFSRISVSLTGEITEVEPQPWVQPLFVDLVAVSGDNKCPQGTSNARHVATLAGLKACAEDLFHTPSGACNCF